MPKLNQISEDRLNTCHAWLQDLVREVSTYIPCTVIEGHRDRVKQMIAYQENKSTKPWPHSKHNTLPSLAVDVAPLPIDWRDIKRFYMFAGFVRGVASQMKIPIISGADWDGDWDIKDQRLHDLVHFEIARAHENKN